MTELTVRMTPSARPSLDGPGATAPVVESGRPGLATMELPITREAQRGAGPIRDLPRRGTYLPGLDGIRALAVVAVLGYHFGVPGAIGGYLGVDIFFVLSGYLISSQLWARWSVGRVDLRAFWAARIRRLLPAVLALIAGCAVLMVAFERAQLGVFAGDVGAAATYTSNWWYILHERSYFESTGRPPVLQHLWSLAVEEQFYLLWPLVVAAVLAGVPRMRARRQVLMGVALAGVVVSAVIMGVGSALADVPGRGDPSRWYFGTDSHAMGLLAGAMLAFARGGAGFGRLMPALSPASRRATAVGVGALLALVTAIALVDEYATWLYRVGFLLVAVVTTVLVAVVTRPGPLATAFAWRPLRYLGRRSYGLYLWHWPVTVFTRPELDVPFDGLRLLVLRATLTLVLAELSYRLVERPVRTLGWSGALALWRSWRPGALTTARVDPLRLPAAQLVAGLTIAMALPPHLALPNPYAPADTRTAAIVKAVPTLTPDQVTRREELSLTVYGDSVAVGARPGLERYVGTLESHAREAEHSWELLPAVADDARAGRIHGNVVLIHTGDNGLVPEEELRGALDALRDVPVVVLVTPKVPRSWERRAGSTIRTVVPDYANVQLADWHEAAQGRAEWLTGDGIHLAPHGEDAYARFVLSRVPVPLPTG